MVFRFVGLRYFLKATTSFASSSFLLVCDSAGCPGCMFRILVTCGPGFLLFQPPPAAATHFDDASEWGASPVSSRAAPYPSHGGDPGKVARACFANDEAQTATSSLPPAAAPQDKPSKLMQQLFFTHKARSHTRAEVGRWRARSK